MIENPAADHSEPPTPKDCTVPESIAYSETKSNTAQGRLRRIALPLGGFLLEAFHLIALFAIGAVTIWAAGHAMVVVLSKPTAPSIEDLLLLFIYLEIGTMVGIYFKTNHMPVRFLIYIAITALTRHLVGFVNAHHKPDIGLVLMTGSILILTLSALVLRYASHRFPSAPAEDSDATKSAAPH